MRGTSCALQHLRNNKSRSSVMIFQCLGGEPYAQRRSTSAMENLPSKVRSVPVAD